MNGRRGAKGAYSSVPRWRLLRDKVSDKKGPLIPSCLIGAFDGHHGNSSSLLLEYSPLPSSFSSRERVHPLSRVTRSLAFLFHSQTSSYECMSMRLTKGIYTFMSRHAINIDDCFERRILVTIRWKLFHRCDIIKKIF